ITDLEQRDPLAESKHFGLTSPLLRWQRSPYRRRWRLTCTVSILLLLVVLLSVSRVSPSAMIESFRRATHHKHIPLTQVRVFLSFLSGMASLVSGMPCGRLIVRSSRFSATHRTVRPWLPCLGWSTSMRHAPANCFASCIPMRRLCRHSTDLRALSV